MMCQPFRASLFLIDLFFRISCYTMDGFLARLPYRAQIRSDLQNNLKLANQMNGTEHGFELDLPLAYLFISLSDSVLKVTWPDLI